MRWERFLPLILLGSVFSEESPSSKAAWMTDAKAARESALKAGKPCVLLLSSDSFAL